MDRPMCHLAIPLPQPTKELSDAVNALQAPLGTSADTYSRITDYANPGKIL